MACLGIHMSPTDNTSSNSKLLFQTALHFTVTKLAAYTRNYKCTDPVLMVNGHALKPHAALYSTCRPHS